MKNITKKSLAKSMKYSKKSVKIHGYRTHYLKFQKKHPFSKTLSIKKL